MEIKPKFTFEPGDLFTDLRPGDIVKFSGPIVAKRPWYLRWLTPLIGPRIVQEKYVQICFGGSADDL